MSDLRLPNERVVIHSSQRVWDRISRYINFKIEECYGVGIINESAISQLMGDWNIPDIQPITKPSSQVYTMADISVSFSRNADGSIRFEDASLVNVPVEPRARP